MEEQFFTIKEDGQEIMFTEEEALLVEMIDEKLIDEKLIELEEKKQVAKEELVELEEDRRKKEKEILMDWLLRSPNPVHLAD